MPNDESLVYLLDDDSRIRDALTALLSSQGRQVMAFADASEYLAFTKPDVPGCLILDLDLPGMTGLELQSELSGSDSPPIIILTGHGDIPSTIQAMKAGAVEFLLKPFDADDLLAATDAAIAADRIARSKKDELREIAARYAKLTPRERDVLPLVVSGLLNKQIAGELGTSEITVRIHRGQVMRKMKADSLAHLVRLSVKLGIA